jgi:hypothetical protein
MNIGEIFLGSVKFTWKHKALWIPTLVITVTALLYGVISSVISTLEIHQLSNPFDPSVFLYSLLTLVLSLGFSVFSMFLGAGQYCMTLWAALQPAPAGPFNLQTVWKGSKPFYWRVMGILVVFGLAAAVIAVPFACLGMAIAVPLSVNLSNPTPPVPSTSSWIALPLLCLLLPVLILSMGLIEQFLLAVVAGNCSFGEGVRRGFRLIGKKLGAILLSAIILGLLLMGIIFPFSYLPIWLIEKLVEAIMAGGNLPGLVGYGIGVLVSSPIYMLVSALLVTFYQTAWASIYRQLTAPPASPAEAVPVEGGIS